MSMTETQLHARWMIRRDLPRVLQIEESSFEFPWSKDDFITCLHQRNCIGMVIEHDENVVGFMIYELHKIRIDLLSFAVHPCFRRRGAGKTMINKLIAKLSYQRRKMITLAVRETNLDGQLFFREMGFRCTNIANQYYEDCPTEPAYFMQYREVPR